MKWYEVRVVYERTIENGQTAKVKEDYMVAAETVTDAERRTVEKLSNEIKGEFEVDTIKKRKIAEIGYSECGVKTWYKAKVNFITLDEKTGSEKKTGSTMLILAADLRDALFNLNRMMFGTASDWVAESVAETSIVEVFIEDEKKEEQPKDEKKK